MYVRKLTLTDFRCFERAELEFRTPDDPKSPQRNVTVLLGTNGAGKSSLLQALSLAILSESLRDTGLRFRDLVRRGEGKVESTLTTECDFEEGVDGALGGTGILEASVERSLSGDVPKLRTINLQDRDEATSRVAWGEASADPSSQSFFLVGYGAQRRPTQAALFDLARQDRRFHVRAQRIASLFADDVNMIPLAAWWPKSKAKAEVQALLDAVLPEELRLTPKLDDSGELVVVFRGTELPETALSDGYRAFLGWFGDLLYRLSQVQGRRKLKGVGGVVLLDEIDLHLHPSWQQDVIDRVSEALPKLQFIVTSHSPLIVGGVRRASLRVLHVGDNGAVSVGLPSEETYGRTADQILLSDAFGLKQVRPAAFVAELEKVRKKMHAGDVATAVRYTRMLALGEAGKGTP